MTETFYIPNGGPETGEGAPAVVRLGANWPLTT